ncbi:MAG: hypothetical protein LBG52_05665 [Candidatus Peribacteria bacterium]|jgi:hypothetical protein|nr:hypothetical protein [Candidatus Peribacteria bacterium]
MIDNLTKILSLLKFENPNEFYFIQIMKRKKDNEEMTGNNRVIKEYCIFSEEELRKKYDEIKKLCEVFNARAYIRLSRRNSEQIAKEMIVALGEAFKNNSYNHLKSIFATTVGRNKGVDKLWIIDIDGDNDIEINKLYIKISRLINSIKPNPGPKYSNLMDFINDQTPDKVVKKIPTPH